MIRETKIFIDCGYLYACTIRKGQIPNYKNIVDILDQKYPDNEKFAYIVDHKNKIKNFQNFLVRIGIDFVNIVEVSYVDKPQIVGASMALDVMRFYKVNGFKYVFISGDAYLIPIIDLLSQKGYEADVYYFPFAFSKDLKNYNCNLSILPLSCAMYQKERDNIQDEQHTGTHRSETDGNSQSTPAVQDS